MNWRLRMRAKADATVIAVAKWCGNNFVLVRIKRLVVVESVESCGYAIRPERRPAQRAHSLGQRKQSQQQSPTTNTHRRRCPCVCAAFFFIIFFIH